MYILLLKALIHKTVPCKHWNFSFWCTYFRYLYQSAFVLLIILLQEIFNCLKILTLKNLEESSCKNFEPHNIRLCNFFLKRSIIEKKTSIIFSQASNAEKHFSSILECCPKHMAYGIQLELMEEKSLIYLCLYSSFLVTWEMIPQDCLFTEEDLLM